MAEGRLVRVLPGDAYRTELDRTRWLVVAPAASASNEVQVFTEWLRAEAPGGTKESAPARGRKDRAV